MGLWHRLRRSGHIHDDVADRFKRHMTSGRILDIPVGGGDNARALAAAGYDVVGADIVADPDRHRDYRIDRVDMTKPLPYPDASFDGILHSEGIEHVDNQVAVLAELARVLKPGGVLIVTTPNVLNLEGRVLGMLSGHNRFAGVVAEARAYWPTDGAPEPIEETYFGHVFLINPFQLRFYLIHVGLEITEVDTARYSINSVLLAPMYPLVWLATTALLRHPRSRVSPAKQREIRKQMLCSSLLFGRKAIMAATKPPAT